MHEAALTVLQYAVDPVHACGQFVRKLLPGTWPEMLKLKLNSHSSEQARSTSIVRQLVLSKSVRLIKVRNGFSDRGTIAATLAHSAGHCNAHQPDLSDLRSRQAFGSR